VIEPLLEAACRRATDGADALWRRVERTSVAFEWGRLKAATATEEAGVNLRVHHGGRVGVAGTTAVDANVDELVTRALASAALGEPVALTFPPPHPLPPLTTFADAAAAAPLDRLIALGRAVLERLARDGCRVNVTVERETSETRVANSAGAAGTYRSTAIVVSADLWRIAGDDVLVVGDASAGTDVPPAEALDTLVRSVNTRLERALRTVPPPEGALPVVFTPAALSALLLPLTQALSGKAVLQGSSPLAGKVGQQVFDARFSLSDDPLARGRPFSRPVDDECVPSRTTRLIERGVVRQFVYDLETAARAKTASTGHGQRSTFGKPTLAYTNLVVGAEDRAGTRPPSDALGGGLVEDVRDGLLVDELIGVGQGNVIGGVFSHPVALAYRIERGAITGRVKDAAVAGNAYELWKRVGGLGHDARWTGERYTPSVLLDGVSVARR
jgi:PmbA protein